MPVAEEFCQSMPLRDIAYLLQKYQATTRDGSRRWCEWGNSIWPWEPRRQLHRGRCRLTIRAFYIEQMQRFVFPSTTFSASRPLGYYAGWRFCLWPSLQWAARASNWKREEASLIKSICGYNFAGKSSNAANVARESNSSRSNHSGIWDFCSQQKCLNPCKNLSEKRSDSNRICFEFCKIRYCCMHSGFFNSLY